MKKKWFGPRKRCVSSPSSRSPSAVDFACWRLVVTHTNPYPRCRATWACGIVSVSEICTACFQYIIRDCRYLECPQETCDHCVLVSRQLRPCGDFMKNTASHPMNTHDSSPITYEAKACCLTLTTAYWQFSFCLEHPSNPLGRNSRSEIQSNLVDAFLLSVRTVALNSFR